MSPIFVYRCEECKLDFEEMRQIAEADNVGWCPECFSQCKQVPAPPARMIRGKGNWSSPA